MNRTSLPRLAWFTPLPPVRSGISRYSAELLPTLADRYAIDVFVDGDPTQVESPDPRITVRSAHDFVWIHEQQPYTLVLYQLGNATWHDYMWGYLARYPGLVVLHDGQLHYARGRLLRQQGRAEDYVEELAYDHPGIDPAMIELALGGRLHQMVRLWPMRRVAVASARMVAVHSRWLADEIVEDGAAATIAWFDMGVPPLSAAADAYEAVRRTHRLQPDAVVLLALGEVTPEKRIPRVLRQLGAVARDVPSVHLLLAGAAADHYDVMADARAHGVADRVTLAGYLPHGRLADYIAAADVCLCLRWPTSRETSAAWLRCLAGGRPTIVTDLAHTVDVPGYDPRSWTVPFAPSTRVDALGWPVRDDAACVAVDLLDEEHSLRLAMQRLATDRRLRERLGTEARQLWQRRFTLERMSGAYLDVIEAAMQQPPRPASQLDLPAHFRADHSEHALTLLRDIGLSESQLSGLIAGQRDVDDPRA
jgi:glycosyltransferase involved in cell wall biosynthesis